MLWWWPMLTYRLPFSGDVVQDIAPRTYWDLPFSGDYNAGDRELERRIIDEAAGYGRQLGIMLDALEKLIDDAPSETRQHERYLKVRDLAQRIRDTKRKRYETALPAALESYRKIDPEGFARLMTQFSEPKA